MQPGDQRLLLVFAEEWVRARVAGSPLPAIPQGEGFEVELGLFVTLRIEGELRGCIGSIEPRGRVSDLTAEMADAALEDSRFVHERIQPEELDHLELEITLLGKPRRISGPSEIEVGRHGIIVRVGGMSGVYLPQVATEQGWSALQTLEFCCRHKLGMPADSWRLPDAVVSVFEGSILSRKQEADGR